jgi:hypothetical protein
MSRLSSSVAGACGDQAGVSPLKRAGRVNEVALIDARALRGAVLTAHYDDRLCHQVTRPIGRRI